MKSLSQRLAAKRRAKRRAKQSEGAATTALKKGDKVYRIGPRIAHDDTNQEPWEVEARTVASASDKVIALTGCFHGIWRSRFSVKPTVSPLGRVFFATPAEAVAAFLVQQRELIESYKRKIVEANDAITWAADWAAVEKIADEAFAEVRKEHAK